MRERITVRVTRDGRSCAAGHTVAFNSIRHVTRNGAGQFYEM